MKNISKFFKLKNNQWLKILFNYYSIENSWYMTIVVSNTKRKCNDCINKSNKSPKNFFGKCTGQKLGLEPFVISLNELNKFEKSVHNCKIIILGENNRLQNIYKRLIKYDYKIKNIKGFNKKREILYKKIK